MEAHFQNVGCLVASRPVDGFIDGFVAQVRRERAVVTTKSARGATFVRFNAPDATLVTLACEAIAGPGGSSLRFGFAAGVKEREQTTQDSLSISNRSIALARELAAAAAKGEVLVSPQLAVGLVESGFTFQTREVRLAGGRKVMACALDVGGGVASDEPGIDEPAAAAQRSAAALGSVFQALLAQAEEIARRQGELEARQDAMPGPSAATDAGAAAAARPPGFEAELDAQLARLEQRLAAIGHIEERVERLQRVNAQVEGELAAQLARRAEVDTLKTLCDTLSTQLVEVRRMAGDMAGMHERVEELLRRLGDAEARVETVQSRQRMVEAVQARAHSVAHMLDDINLKLELLTEQRAVVDHVSERLAQLDFTLQEAHNTLRALQREREVAERIEQGIKALRAGSGIGKAALPSA
jgi:hypothetical protein